MMRINMASFNLRQAANKQLAALGLYAETAAQQMVEHAKPNAPWTDRTTNARESISGGHYWKGNTLVVRISGGMEYSVYLELAMEKRWAILRPTVERFAPEVLSGYQRLVKD